MSRKQCIWRIKECEYRYYRQKRMPLCHFSNWCFERFFSVVLDYLVDARKSQFPSIVAIELNCEGPSSNGKKWFSGQTSVVKNGLVQDCHCCKFVSLTETQNLNITNVSDLCDYQCEIPFDYCQFPVKGSSVSFITS